MRRTLLNLHQADSLAFSGLRRYAWNYLLRWYGCVHRHLSLVYVLASSAIEAAMLAWPLRVLSHVRPVMRDDSSYSRDQPVNLRQFAPRLDDVTSWRAQAAGPGRVRSRSRGCRAGKRKNSTGALSSIS